MTEFIDKKSTRKYYSKLRENVPDRLDKEAAAAERMLSSDYVRNADAVLIFRSVGSEISTLSITDALLKTGKPVALPRCQSGGTMTFHLIDSPDDLIKGKYGIPEPQEHLPQPTVTDKTLCIVPALAFTESGHRLGYGGGYYDRFIAANPQALYVGFGFDEFISEQLPLDKFDRRINAIITDRRMVFCSAE